MKFSEIDAKILNRIQRDIPIDEKPFERISSELGHSNSDLLQIISRLKDEGVIRNISGIFNAENLGYQISLIAFEVPEEHIEDAAYIINSNPGVSHNYLRDHRYNIWFTLAVEDNRSLEDTASILAELSHARDILIMKNERLLKIGLMLKIGDDTSEKYNGNSASNQYRNAGSLTEEEKEAIRLLQFDLPLEERPFRSIIEKSESFLSEERLVLIGEHFKHKGIMRRYSAVLRHRSAGYGSNAMTVWRPETGKDIKDIADVFISEASISHLYIRTVYPGKWEYPLFAMVHAKSPDELINTVKRLSKESMIEDYMVLNTLREFKKKRVTYFSKEFQEWERGKHD